MEEEEEGFTGAMLRLALEATPLRMHGRIAAGAGDEVPELDWCSRLDEEGVWDESAEGECGVARLWLLPTCEGDEAGIGVG